MCRMGEGIYRTMTCPSEAQGRGRCFESVASKRCRQKGEPAAPSLPRPRQQAAGRWPRTERAGSSTRTRGNRARPARRPRGDRVDSAHINGQHHDEHRQGVPGSPAGEHHAAGEPRTAEGEAARNRQHDHRREPNPLLHLHRPPPDAISQPTDLLTRKAALEDVQRPPGTPTRTAELRPGPTPAQP